MSSVGRRLRAIAPLAALLASTLAIVPASAKTICVPDNHPGGDWPMMNHDYAGTRHQPDERTLGRAQAATLAPAWTFSANDATGMIRNEITSYPIVADGCVFVGSSTGLQKPGWVFALNADGGDLSWKTKLPYGVYSSPAVSGGVVYVFMSKVGAPTLVALDQLTGNILWMTEVNHQPGSDAVSSPIVFDGLVWVGVSGTAAEGDEQQRFDFRGASVLVDAARDCSATSATLCTDPVPGAMGGAIVKHTWSIPDEDWEDGEGDAGGAIWSTISIDTATKYGYVGAGNPFNFENEHAHTNAVLKVDLDRTRSTFGEIVGSYKGDVEQYFGELQEVNEQCENDQGPAGPFLAGFDCLELDLDFGAAPNIITDRTGQKWIGAGQKSGVYHMFDPDTMQPKWKQVIGFPSAVGGIVGTPAFDGTAIYVPHTLVGYLTALDRDNGAHRWLAPIGDGVHWGNPVTTANGVVYTVDLRGFLDAYDAATGAPLLHRPLALGSQTGSDVPFTWGGVSVARNTVYATVGVGLTSAGDMFPSMPNGFVIAFRPARIMP